MSQTAFTKAYRQDISIMRVLSTLLIVLLHTCSTLTENVNIINNFGGGQYNCIYALSQLLGAVLPIFFMITGVLLLSEDKEITVKDCIFKYAKRMVLAIIIFGIPFSFIKQFAENKTVEFSMIPNSLISILTNGSLSHLWYLYTLIGIYMFLPLIKLYVNNATHDVQRYILIILFIFNFIIPAINSVFLIDIAFSSPILKFGLFYLLLGKYLDDSEIKLSKKFILIIGIILSIVMIAGTLFLKGFALWYSNPILAMLSAVLFILLKNTEIKNVKLSKTVLNMDRLCFCVYLIHPVFIQMSYRVAKITPLTFSSFWIVFIFIFWIVFSGLSFASAWILMKIKPMKKYVL